MVQLAHTAQLATPVATVDSKKKPSNRRWVVLALDDCLDNYWPNYFAKRVAVSRRLQYGECGLKQEPGVLLLEVYRV